MSELKIAVMEGNAQRAGALLMEDSPSATALADACTTIGALRDGLAALQMSEKEGAGAVAARADFERRKAALAASTTELEKLAAAKTAAGGGAAAAAAAAIPAAPGSEQDAGAGARGARALTRMVSEAQGSGALVRREGYLQKRNQKGGWGKRWCVLEGGSFLYYSSREAAAPKKGTAAKPPKPRGCVPITATSKLTREPGDDAMNFQVLTVERAYELHAESNDEMLGWLHALKENLAVLRTRVTSL